MPLHATLADVTARIEARSAKTRAAYLEMIRRAGEAGPRRGHLGCSGQAHAYAAMGDDKAAMAAGRAPNLGIVTAYNDMLSAHQPYAAYPEIIKAAARARGATAQVAGGVPAMCDGVTQGESGMELSLFSRDVIALSAAIALSHATFDAALFLGVCDKIVPGLVIAAARFGHLPAVFIPAGPMTSGLSNDAKSEIRKKYALGEIGRNELLAGEMAAYHGPGTCTFYGTANSNQMLMEFMGMHLPGASFVNPDNPLRDALTVAATERAVQVTALGNAHIPAAEILDAKGFANGIVGLMATGGSTNLLIHLIAMARAAGLILKPEDFAQISDAAPLMARVYPNGLADVNQFHAAGGLSYIIGELLDAGLLHPDVTTIMGKGLAAYTHEPKLKDGRITWEAGAKTSLNEAILRPAAAPFQPTGGLKRLVGNLGAGVMKVSAVKPENRIVEAPARVFEDQNAVKAAFKAGKLTGDMVVVVRGQGPRANGMPELHGLTPTLSVLMDRGQKVALVTDGRMSGASGKVPAAIHVTPEARDGGMIARLRDDDILRVDGTAGRLEVLTGGVADRPLPATAPAATEGNGRELFAMFRAHAGSAETGAAGILGDL